ncbi:MAG: VPEID-CTERM sorting domain-containing protein [Paracoccaceae bacterium]
MRTLWSRNSIGGFIMFGKIHFALIAGGVWLSGAAGASAQSWGSGGRWRWDGWSPGRPGGDTGGTPAASVPEIDASTGLLALAAVGAGLALAWEINRRRQRANS